MTTSTLLKLLLIASYSSLLAFLNRANAVELRVAFVTDRAPYCFKDNGIDSGIEVDLIRAALKRMNCARNTPKPNKIKAT